MCFHYKQTKSGLELEKQFKSKSKKGIVIEPVEYINGFTFADCPIILNNDNEREINKAKWGLLPEFCNDSSSFKYTLNAKIETLSEKPSFNKYINNRCIIPADGFYEWKWLNATGSKKEKYFITSNDSEGLVIAGIYNQWNDYLTFSMVTTQANDLMAEIHNVKKRMPIMLKKEDIALWLNGFDYLSFQFPYEIPLKAEKISDSNILTLF